MNSPITPLPPALCLMGPTACGKTRAAVELAASGPYEIISVDSALIYRGMDIGTGKPDKDTLVRAPHRLVDILDLVDSYSAAEFRNDCIKAMTEILAKGKIPLLVGGTMLYFRALKDGLAAMPSANESIRQQILEQAATEGWAAVHARLAAVDPQAAARIHPNDPQRLQRALEVYEVTGVSLTEHHKAKPQGSATDLPCELIFFAMIPESRAQLHQVIADRFHAMLTAGLVDEVAALKQRSDLHPALPSIRSVGYRQVWEYLDGLVDYDTMVAKGIAATRQLAKRQHTWLRSWKDCEELTCTLSLEDVSNVKNRLKLRSPSAIYW